MKNLLLLLLLFIYDTTAAQISFEKGYFISNSNEKTDCFIKNYDWKDNPNEIEYKINLADNEVKKGTILNVQEFGIDNVSKYKRFKIQIERSSDNTNDISKSKDPIWKEETLFLKTLIDGDATLYSYTEGNLFKYFYETKTVPAEQLVRIKFFYTDANDVINTYDIKENNKFRGQLFNSLKCSALSENDFTSLKYDKSSLLKLFVKYNSCSVTSTVNFEEKNKTKSFNLKVTSSINQTSLAITDPNIYYNSSTDLQKIVVQIGGELEYVLPYNKNTWSLFLNPSYQKFSADKTFVRNDGFGVLGKDVTANVNADYTAIDMPFGVRHYFFVSKGSRILINVAYALSLSNKSNIEITNNGKTILTSGSRSNIAFGVGYSFKNKYSLELRYNTARQILSDYISWSAKYSSIGVVLGYKIF